MIYGYSRKLHRGRIIIIGATIVRTDLVVPPGQAVLSCRETYSKLLTFQKQKNSSGTDLRGGGAIQHNTGQELSWVGVSQPSF